jgi:hypothetical protein
MRENPTGPEIIMIVDRYDPMNLFELVPKLKLEFEPELAQLDRLLDVTMNSSSSSRRIFSNATPTRRGSGGAPPRWR